MRTETIYKARIKAGYRYVNEYPGPCARQLATFDEELKRRMDHYDWYEARQRYFDEPTPEGREAMNAAYRRYQSHPREQAKAAKWREGNGI